MSTACLDLHNFRRYAACIEHRLETLVTTILIKMWGKALDRLVPSCSERVIEPGSARNPICYRARPSSEKSAKMTGRKSFSSPELSGDVVALASGSEQTHNVNARR